MATPFALPGLDQENEALKARLAYADALRNKSINTKGQMVDGIYVPKNPWENFAEAFGGSAMRGYHEAERTRADQGRAAEEQSWLNKMPGATTQTDILNDQQAAALMGNDVNPVARTVAKSPEQMIGEQQAWIQQAPASSQIGNAARGAILTQALNAPYKAMEREDAQAAVLEKAREQYQARMDQIREAEAQRRITREEADARALEAKREMKYLGAALAKAVGGAVAGAGAADFGGPRTVEGNDPTTGAPIMRHTKSGRLFTYDQGGQPVPYATSIGPKSKETTEAERVSAGYLGRMQAAEKGMSEAPALGLIEQSAVNTVPMLGNYLLDEKQQAARQKQEDWVRAKLRKESGAVIAPEEMRAEIRTYFPQPGDSPEAIASKIQARAQAVEQLKSTAGRAKAIEAGNVGKTIVREVKLKDGRTGVEYSDGTRGYK